MYNSRQSGNNDHRKVELVIFRDIFATEAVEICHVELVGPLVCSLVDFKVANNPRDTKEVDKYNCKERIYQVIGVRNARHSVETVDDPYCPHTVPDLEKVEDDEVGCPVGVASSVMEHQTPQVLELDDGIVSESSSLIALFALNADTDVSALDHVDVVEAIANPQHHLLIGQVANHFGHLRLLGR